MRYWRETAVFVWERIMTSINEIQKEQEKRNAFLVRLYEYKRTWPNNYFKFSPLLHIALDLSKKYGIKGNDEIWSIASYLAGEDFIERYGDFNAAITHKGIKEAERLMLQMATLSAPKQMICTYCGASFTVQQETIQGTNRRGDIVVFCSHVCKEKSVNIDWRIPTIEPALLGTTRVDFLAWLDGYRYVASSRVNFEFNRMDELKIPKPLLATYDIVQIIRGRDDVFREKRVPVWIEMFVKDPKYLEIHPFVKSWGQGELYTEELAEKNLAALKIHLNHIISSAKEAFPISAQSKIIEPSHPQESPEVKVRRQGVKELYLANEIKNWQIANRMGVSVSTINRDLKILEDLGEIKRKRNQT